MTAKISVAMATYNGEAFLKEQLESIYSQTVQPFEVIVIDDGSRDSTICILEKYQKQRGLKYFVNTENKGVNYSFSRAISACVGEYIALSDQDDVWNDTKLETLLAVIETMPPREPNLVTSAVTDVDSQLRIVFKRNIILAPKNIADFVPDLFMQGSTQIFNVEIKNRLEIPADGVYDLHISTLALIIGNRRWLSESTMKYRHHSRNVCAQWNRSISYLRFRKLCEQFFLNYRFQTRYFETYFTPCFNRWEKDIPNDRRQVLQQISRIQRSPWKAFLVRGWNIYKRTLVFYLLWLSKSKLRET